MVMRLTPRTQRLWTALEALTSVEKEKKWSVVYRPGAQLWDVEVAFVDLQARLSLPFH